MLLWSNGLKSMRMDLQEVQAWAVGRSPNVFSLVSSPRREPAQACLADEALFEELHTYKKLHIPISQREHKLDRNIQS